MIHHRCRYSKASFADRQAGQGKCLESQVAIVYEYSPDQGIRVRRVQPVQGISLCETNVGHPSQPANFVLAQTGVIATNLIAEGRLEDIVIHAKTLST